MDALMTINALKLLASGVSTGVTALTLTRSRPLKGIRRWIRYRNDWLGELVSCPYCMSHWIAGGIVLWLRPGSLLHWFLGTAISIAIAMPIAAIVFQAVITVSPSHEEVEIYAEEAH